MDLMKFHGFHGFHGSVSRFSLDSIAISAWRLTVVWDVLLWFLEGRDFGHKFSKFHTVLWNIHSYSIDFITNYFMGKIWEFSANISMNQHVFFLDSDTTNTNIGCPSKFTEELPRNENRSHRVILMSPSESLIRPHVGRLRKPSACWHRPLKPKTIFFRPFCAWDARFGQMVQLECWNLIHWLIDSSISWFIDSLVYWLAGSLILWFISSLFHWFIGSLIRSFMVSLFFWFIDLLTHWFPESLIHCFIRSVAHGFFHVFDSSLFLHLKKKPIIMLFL